MWKVIAFLLFLSQVALSNPTQFFQLDQTISDDNPWKEDIEIERAARKREELELQKYYDSHQIVPVPFDSLPTPSYFGYPGFFNFEKLPNPDTSDENTVDRWIESYEHNPYLFMGLPYSVSFSATRDRSKEILRKWHPDKTSHPRAKEVSALALAGKDYIQSMKKPFMISIDDVLASGEFYRIFGLRISITQREKDAWMKLYEKSFEGLHLDRFMIYNFNEIVSGKLSRGSQRRRAFDLSISEFTGKLKKYIAAFDSAKEFGQFNSFKAQFETMVGEMSFLPLFGSEVFHLLAEIIADELWVFGKSMGRSSGSKLKAFYPAVVRPYKSYWKRKVPSFYKMFWKTVSNQIILDRFKQSIAWREFSWNYVADNIRYTVRKSLSQILYDRSAELYQLEARFEALNFMQKVFSAAPIPNSQEMEIILKDFVMRLNQPWEKSDIVVQSRDFNLF